MAINYHEQPAKYLPEFAMGHQVSLTEEENHWADLSLFADFVHQSPSSDECPTSSTDGNLLDYLNLNVMHVYTAEELTSELDDLSDSKQQDMQLVFVETASTSADYSSSTSDGSGEVFEWESASLPDAGDGMRNCGWTVDDDDALHRLVDGELAKVRGIAHKLDWGKITATLNELLGQNRSKDQVYSHFRNWTADKRRPCYTPAEEEAMRKLDEMNIPCKVIAQLMPHDRNESQITQKLAKLKASPYPFKPDDEEYIRRMKYRQKVKSVALDIGLPIESVCISPESIKRMRLLITMDPKLQKNNHSIGVGRPAKNKPGNGLSNDAYEELALLLRPFTYVNNRRKRTTSLAGDGRRYGANMFAIYRLLGCPFNLDKMPKDEDEAKAAGVKEVDIKTYNVLRDMIEQFGSEKIEEDRKIYQQNPGRVPMDSLLPPTLFTTTGLRGLTLNLDVLKKQAESGEPTTKKIKTEHGSTGCAKADQLLMRTLESLFTYSWFLGSNMLQNPKKGPGENSDLDTDSDEESVWQSDHVKPSPDKIDLNQKASVYE